MPRENTAAVRLRRGSRFSRRTKVVAIVVGLVGVASTAFAFWTTAGSGSGTGQTASSVQDVEIIQTSTVTGVAPGSGTHALSGTISNPNSGPVYISSISATVTPKDANGDAIVGCTAADYTIAGSPAAVNAQALANDTTTWSGITVAFNNTADNQDACKGAVLHFTYTAQ